MPAARTPPLPDAFVLRAEAAWQAVDFISDLHLSENQPATFDRWARCMRSTDADAVLILGDLFEVWFGDDASLPGSFGAAVADVLAETGSHRLVAFMAGNRDFLVGRDWLHQRGVLWLPDPCVLDAWGRRVLLSHGDALCLDDADYQAFRAEVRSEQWRARFLALPMTERRRVAHGMRAASEAQKRHRPIETYADVDSAAAVDWLAASDCETLVHGHTHRPGTHALAAQRQRLVLADWDFDNAPPRGQVLRLTRDGFARVELAP